MSFTKRTIITFPELTRVCSDALASMWVMKKELEGVFRKLMRELPASQKWVSIYFFGNMIYLRAAYFLACEGSCRPSWDLQRTAYETILRGYLFIVDESEADLLHSYLEGNVEARKILRKRNFYPIDFLQSQLYTPSSRRSHKKIFKELSYFSHPTIRGAMLDLQYSEENVKYCLNGVLYLTYGTVQMLTEGFFDLLDEPLRAAIKDTLEKIANFLKEVPIFEPDQERWSSKIRLRKGNFLAVLSSRL